MSKVTDVGKCSACGEDHKQMHFHALPNPDDEGFTHVGQCENTGRFVYLKDIQDASNTET